MIILLTGIKLHSILEASLGEVAWVAAYEIVESHREFLGVSALWKCSQRKDTWGGRHRPPGYFRRAVKSSRPQVPSFCEVWSVLQDELRYTQRICRHA